MENQTRNKVKVLRINNGGELCEKESERFLQGVWYIMKKRNSIYTPMEWSCKNDEHVSDGEGEDYVQW